MFFPFFQGLKEQEVTLGTRPRPTKDWPNFKGKSELEFDHVKLPNMNAPIKSCKQECFKISTPSL